MRLGFVFTMMVAAAMAAGCAGENTNTSATGGAGAPATPEATTPDASNASNRVAIEVTEEGFVPAVVNVRAGQPVTLVVTRKTEKTCATELVMKEHNINQPLPMNQPVEITFTPAQSGDLPYACAMDMIKGTVHVD
jgi:plastocyanin domain-containing protein